MPHEQEKQSKSLGSFHPLQSRRESSAMPRDQWDSLELVDDVYCSDTFNLFNDIY